MKLNNFPYIYLLIGLYFCILCQAPIIFSYLGQIFALSPLIIKFGINITDFYNKLQRNTGHNLHFLKTDSRQSLPIPSTKIQSLFDIHFSIQNFFSSK